MECEKCGLGPAETIVGSVYVCLPCYREARECPDCGELFFSEDGICPVCGKEVKEVEE